MAFQYVPAQYQPAPPIAYREEQQQQEQQKLNMQGLQSVLDKFQGGEAGGALGGSSGVGAESLMSSGNFSLLGGTGAEGLGATGAGSSGSSFSLLGGTGAEGLGATGASGSSTGSFSLLGGTGAEGLGASGAGASGSGSAGAAGSSGMGAAGIFGIVAAAIAAQHQLSNETDTEFEGVETDDAFAGHFATEPWLAWAHDKLGLEPTAGEKFDAAIANDDWTKTKERFPAALSYWGNPADTWIQSTGEAIGIDEKHSKWLNPIGEAARWIGEDLL